MKLLGKFAVGLVAVGIGTAVCAQELTGTLKKIKDTGAITIGIIRLERMIPWKENSPFSSSANPSPSTNSTPVALIVNRRVVASELRKLTSWMSF